MLARIMVGKNSYLPEQSKVALHVARYKHILCHGPVACVYNGGTVGVVTIVPHAGDHVAHGAVVRQPLDILHSDGTAFG